MFCERIYVCALSSSEGSNRFTRLQVGSAGDALHQSLHYGARRRIIIISEVDVIIY